MNGNAVERRWTRGVANIEVRTDKVGGTSATSITDLATRMAAHAVALDNGVRTLSEVRALEDLAPLTPEQWAEWAAWQEPATLFEVRTLEDLAPLTPEQWAEWAAWQVARGNGNAIEPAMAALGIDIEPAMAALGIDPPPTGGTA